MHLIVLGLNHKTAPVEVRECYAMPVNVEQTALSELIGLAEIDEAVILSTCNRTEIYAVVSETGTGIAALQDYFVGLSNASKNDIEQYFYWFIDADAAEHIFRVASSLDSLVIGEGQILSQVKEAWLLAHETGAAGTLLNLLFHRAVTVGKMVRTQTRIAFSPVSVSSAAVALAEKECHSLSDKTALIFGAGKMAELTAQHLLAHGIGTLYVANRHYEKAVEFAEKYGGEAVSFAEAFDRATGLDIVLTSTGAPHYVVHARAVKRFMAKRGGRPLMFIDIAVPRDVDPQVAEVDGVTLYNIDGLSEIVEEHKKQRTEEAELAGKIVYEELAAFLDKLKYLTCRPLMATLSARSEALREREVKRAMSKLPDLTESERRTVEGMSRMIVRKLLREPMSAIARAAGTEQEAEYTRAMQILFDLRDCEEETDEE